MDNPQKIKPIYLIRMIIVLGLIIAIIISGLLFRTGFNQGGESSIDRNEEQATDIKEEAIDTATEQTKQEE